MRRRGLPLALAALLVLPPGRAPAWNSVGHFAVARLAYAQLGEGQQRQVGRLLRAHPHYDEYLAKNRPADVGPEEWAFLRASTWPDWVRALGRNDPRGERVGRYNRPADHYIDTPFVLPADQALFAGKDLRPEPDGDNVVNALRWRLAELRAAESSDADRAVALCWVLHLVGDVHQPLHCANLYSALFPDKGGDLGGNLFGIKVNGRATNLHRYWDDLLGEDPNYREDTAENQAKVYALAKQAAEELHDPRYGRDRYPELADDRTLAGWAREGYDLARTVVYRNGEIRPVRVGPGGQVPPDAAEVGEEYQRTAVELAHRRVALAGYRLADKLKEALPAP